MLCGIAQRRAGHPGAVFSARPVARPGKLAAAFLGTYFIAAAVSIPLWLRLVQRIGLASRGAWEWRPAWSYSRAPSTLGARHAAFLVVLGLMLGSDSFSPAPAAGVIDDAGDRGRAEGAYGWWNFATKLNPAPRCPGFTLLAALATRWHRPIRAHSRSFRPLIAWFRAGSRPAAWLQWRLHSPTPPLIPSVEVT